MKQLSSFLSQPVWGLLALAFAGLVVGAFLTMRKRGRENTECSLPSSKANISEKFMSSPTMCCNTSRSMPASNRNAAPNGIHTKRVNVRPSSVPKLRAVKRSSQRR